MTNSTINITERIIKKLKDLPLKQQQQILDCVEFITEKYQKTQVNQATTFQQRIPGLHKGKIWIDDDFNEPMSPEDLLTT